MTNSTGQLSCAICGEPASCVGAYENATTPALACDECCGHGNEDGHCEPIASANRQAEATSYTAAFAGSEYSRLCVLHT